MNQVLVEGNVVRESVIRETPRGTKVCTVPIATNYYYRDANGETQKDVAFFDVEAWGESFCAKIVGMAKKGRGLRVVGRLKQDRWKNSEGKNISKTYIVAEHIDFQFLKSEDRFDSSEEERSNPLSASEGLRMENDFPSADNEIMEETVEEESVF